MSTSLRSIPGDGHLISRPFSVEEDRLDQHSPACSNAMAFFTKMNFNKNFWGEKFFSEVNTYSESPEKTVPITQILALDDVIMTSSASFEKFSETTLFEGVPP